jgi:hypothetical protein
MDAPPTMEFTHNNRRHSDRKHTPFELMMEVNPLATPLTHEYTKYPSIDNQIRSLINNCEEALAAHEFAQSHMLQRIKSNFQPFIIGQKVWLEARNLKTIYNKKITPKREEPFEITKILSPLTYSLSLPDTWRIHNAFHAFLLTPYVKNEVYRPNYARPPGTNRTRRRMGGRTNHWTSKTWTCFQCVIQKFKSAPTLKHLPPQERRRAEYRQIENLKP